MRREVIYPHRSVRSLHLSAGRLLTVLAAALASTAIVYRTSDSLLVVHNRISSWFLTICDVPLAGSQSVEVFAPIGSTEATMTEVFRFADQPARIAILFVCSVLGLLMVHRRVALARNFVVFV